MVDWILDVLSRSAASLGGASPAEVAAASSLVTVVGLPFLVLVHELGHALAAPALARLALIGGTHGPLDACLWTLSAASVLTAIGNLIPRGRPGTSDLLSDGRIVQLAWAARHMPAGERTDVEAQRPAPSLTPPAPAERPSGMRWPFAAALLLVAVLAFAAGGVALLMPLVVVFGGAVLQGAHRRKAW